jgi:hypothetical protein
MDVDQLHEIEKWLSEQAHTTNENLVKVFLMISNMEVKNFAPPSPVLAPIAPPVTTILSTSQPLWIKPGTPNNFNRDQLKGQAFLTSCELYTSLTASDSLMTRHRSTGHDHTAKADAQ